VSAIVSGPRPVPAPSTRLLRGMEAGATVAPLLCAAHCIAMPLVVVLAPRLAAFEAHERAVMGASLCLAALATVLGFRTHRRAYPLLLVAAGALVWLAAPLLPLPGEVPAVMANLLMAAGTLCSARLRHRATCPRCSRAHLRHDHRDPASVARPAGDHAPRRDAGTSADPSRGAHTTSIR